MSRSAILIAVGTFAALHSPALVKAEGSFPFSIASSGGVDLAIVCHGPWFRVSDCESTGPGVVSRRVFYQADNNFLSPIGQWDCVAYPFGHCTRGTSIDLVTFCGPGERGSPTNVDLTFDGKNLSVNQSATCASAHTVSVLAYNGEEDASPAQDLDSYSFAGKPGEQVKVKLDRDGSAGSAGEVATLRVRAANGAVLGQRTGAVPLSLDLTLPGAVEIAVSRDPGNGDPLRGYYDLEVIPKSGGIGERKLRPTANVEH